MYDCFELIWDYLCSSTSVNSRITEKLLQYKKSKHTLKQNIFTKQNISL